MKIAIVTSSTEVVGGVETFNRDINNLLSNAGHDVTLIGRESLPFESQEPEKDIGLFFNDQNRSERYDIVLCNGEYGYAVEHPHAINIFHGCYWRYAKTFEGIVSDELTEQRLRKAEMQRISAQNKLVVAVSTAEKERILECYGINVDRVIPHSVNTTIFYPQDLQISDHVLALSRGRYYEKGFDILELLAEAGVKLRLFSDRIISSPNVESNGFIDNSLLGLEYNLARAFISPSRFEGGGLTILEAMACGCPVVTTPTGYGLDLKSAIPEFVVGNPGNVEEYFTKIAHVVENRRVYSQAAQDYFWENHSPEGFRQNWLDIVDEVAQTSKIK